MLHPWIGVVLFFGFLGLFLRFWRANLWRREDGTWMARLRDVLAGHEEKLPEVGKYNAGQKMVFWMMSVLIIVLISSGLVMWDQYFFDYTTIEPEARRGAHPCARGDRDHLRLDRARLRGDLGARHHPGHGAAARSPAAGPGGIIANGCGSWSPARAAIEARERSPPNRRVAFVLPRGPCGS